jgi:hypothetical protein
MSYYFKGKCQSTQEKPVGGEAQNLKKSGPSNNLAIMHQESPKQTVKNRALKP